MSEDRENYRDVEIFMDTYVKHGITGLAAFHGILDYAQYVDKINYKQAQQLLYDFVGKMLLPEDYK